MLKPVYLNIIKMLSEGWEIVVNKDDDSEMFYYKGGAYWQYKYLTSAEVEVCKMVL